MEGEPHKSPKVVDFVEPALFPEAISKAPVDFLDFRLLGPPKWREPYNRPKCVDFVESAPFPEAISKAPVDFLISGFWDRRNGGNPTTGQNVSIL